MKEHNRSIGVEGQTYLDIEEKSRFKALHFMVKCEFKDVIEH